MASDAPTPQPGPWALDWRLFFSLGVTFVWVMLGIIYITSVVGWIDFATLNASSLGSFLEGAFAPLAFLWLVVGFFMQQTQLSQNTKVVEQQLEALRQTAEQAKVQSQAIAADELHSRQDTYLKVAAIVAEQLGTTAGFLVNSWEAEALPQEEWKSIELWDRFGAGDSNAFGLRIMALCFTNAVEPTELFYGTPIRRQHTENFTNAFENLLERARSCDPDDMIGAALRGSQNGRVYRFMLESKPGHDQDDGAEPGD